MPTIDFSSPTGTWAQCVKLCETVIEHGVSLENFILLCTQDILLDSELALNDTQRIAVKVTPSGVKGKSVSDSLAQLLDFILYAGWQEMSLDEASALTNEQRERIIIIVFERARLLLAEIVAQLTEIVPAEPFTALPSWQPSVPSISAAETTITIPPATTADEPTTAPAVFLSWEHDDTISTLLIERRTGDGEFSSCGAPVRPTSPTGSVIDKNVEPGVTYSYRIRAKYKFQISDWSSESTVTLANTE